MKSGLRQPRGAQQGRVSRAIGIEGHGTDQYCRPAVEDAVGEYLAPHAAAPAHGFVMKKIYRLVYYADMTSQSSKGSATRQRLTESMLQLIQTTGYHGAGLTAVVEHSAAPKGSLYFHFPGGKAELGSAAVALAAEQFRGSIMDAMAVSRSFEELVDVVINELGGLLVSSDYRAGCPVAAVTLDAGAHDEQLRAACSDAYASWVATFHDYLASSGRDADDIHSLATSAVCLIEGALIVCRAQKSTEPLASASRTLKGLLGPILKQGGTQ